MEGRNRRFGCAMNFFLAQNYIFKKTYIASIKDKKRSGKKADTGLAEAHTG